jgi:fructosamine-3-kinase
MNAWTSDGHEFFSVQRLIFQADLAERGGYLEKHDREGVEKVIQKLPDLVPMQPASLLHGDLWSGNAIVDSDGNPAMIDPATHYGWAEAELGMTALFGGFPREFYLAYNEERPLASGWRERLSIYNLYHLLNHVNLFGFGYLGQVRAIIQRFV